MFRFTIRDVLWLTVVVALSAGWIVRENRLQSKLTTAARWRMAAGALEDILREDGWSVQWGYREDQVLLVKCSGASRFSGASTVHTSRVVTQYEPTADQP